MHISTNSLWKSKRPNLLVAVTILSFFLTSTSCDSSVNYGDVSSEPKASPSASIDALCEHIREIKMLPQKDDPVSDPAFNSLMDAGDRAIPCLIEKITDTTVMADPRQAPKVTGVTEGDIAYFILLRVAKIDFVELLPPDVQKAYEQNGVYGYFEQINEGSNRQILQEASYKWYEQKYSIKLRKE